MPGSAGTPSGGCWPIRRAYWVTQVPAGSSSGSVLVGSQHSSRWPHRRTFSTGSSPALRAAACGGRPRPADHRPTEPNVSAARRSKWKSGNSHGRGFGMGIEPRQRRVNTAMTALLVVGAVLVLIDLARVMLLDLTGSDRPSDRRC